MVIDKLARVFLPNPLDPHMTLCGLSYNFIMRIENVREKKKKLLTVRFDLGFLIG